MGRVWSAWRGGVVSMGRGVVSMGRGSGQHEEGSGQHEEGSGQHRGGGVVSMVRGSGQQVQNLIGLPLPRTPPVNRQLLFYFDPALDL